MVGLRGVKSALHVVVCTHLLLLYDTGHSASVPSANGTITLPQLLTMVQQLTVEVAALKATSLQQTRLINSKIARHLSCYNRLARCLLIGVCMLYVT